MTERKCRQGDHRDSRDDALFRIAYIGPNGGDQQWTTDVCERHAAILRERYIREGRRSVRIVPAGWTPESDKITDAMVEALRRHVASNIGRGNVRRGLAAALDAQREPDRSTRASRIADLTRALMREIGQPELSWPDLDPYPATVGEVADEIVRFVLELETGPARGVLGEVMDRLAGMHAGLYPPEIKSATGAPAVDACFCYPPDHRAGCPETRSPL